jgi:hypothetical protein
MYGRLNLTGRLLLRVKRMPHILHPSLNTYKQEDPYQKKVYKVWNDRLKRAKEKHVILPC